MDNKDIVIIVLSVLLVVTLAVLIYLITQRRSPVGYGGGQYGPGYLPNEIAPEYHTYRNTQGARQVDALKAKHEVYLNSILQRDLRIMKNGPSLMDIVHSPFNESLDDAAQRQYTELSTLQQQITRNH